MSRVPRTRPKPDEAPGARRRRGRDWVSKTDLLRFLRCPYAFVQVDRGLLAAEALIDPISRQLIDDGTEFHEQVVAAAVPMPEDVSLADALVGDSTLLGLPVLRNKRLKLLGAPDGVQAADGALLPIEIKSHKDVRRSDLLELAFYWLLLEPYRTRHDIAPRGELILRRDGVPEPVAVEIEDEHFDEVRSLVRGIRRARRNGVKPRVCGCAACRGPLSEQVRELTSEGKDLTMIWGIARRFATALEALGLANYEALIGCDPDAVVNGLREQRLFVSVSQVEQWRRHAQAYQETQAVVFGPPAPVEEAFIAIDLEYDPIDPFIWLIGILVSNGERREHVFLWADNKRQEKQNLQALGELVRVNTSLPVISWGGVMADLPQLQAASDRHRLGQTLAPVVERHLDLFLHAARTLRLPTPSLSLGGIAAYFGIPKTSMIADGFEAQSKFGRYQRSRSRSEKQQLRQELLDYNRDDLEMLAGAHQAIRDLQSR